MGYRENKERSKIHTVGETMTDQAGAAATDINIIVKKMNQTGIMPGSARPPVYADMSDIPTNLQDMLEMSKGIEEHRERLPPALRALSATELLTTDPKRLAQMVTEHDRYIERHTKLPAHLKSLSRQDVLNLTDEQLTNIITPVKPTAPTPEQQK